MLKKEWGVPFRFQRFDFCGEIIIILVMMIIEDKITLNEGADGKLVRSFVLQGFFPRGTCRVSPRLRKYITQVQLELMAS
jgi:hypothetical protein